MGLLMNPLSSLIHPVSDRGRRRREFLLLHAFFLLVTVVMFPGMFRHFFSGLPFPHPDILGIVSPLEWQCHFMLRAPALVPSLGAFYPHSWATYFFDPMYGIMVIFFALKLLGLNVYAVYNSFILICFLGGAWGVYRLGREIGVDKSYAAVGAAFTIFFSVNAFMVMWLNFFAIFLLPWCILHLLRYLRGKQRRDAWLFSLFILLQTLTAFYIGIYFLAFLFPLFMLCALIFRLWRWRELPPLVLGLGAVAALLTVVYFPFLVVKKYVVVYRPFTHHLLPNVSHLFTANHSWLFTLWKGAQEGLQHTWFPGVLVFALTLLAAYAPAGNRNPLRLAGFTAAAAAIVLLQPRFLAAATLLLLALALLLLVRFWRRRRENPALTALVFAYWAYIFLYFDFSTLGLPPRFLPYSFIIEHISFIKGLRGERRAFIVLIPLTALLLARGLQTLLQGRKWSRWVLPLLLALMMAENFNPAMLAWNSPLPDHRAAVYRSLPRGQDKIVLEIPFYGRLVRRQEDITPADLEENYNRLYNWENSFFRNNIYSYCQRFHWNFLVNGRASLYPEKFPELLERTRPWEVFKSENLRWLKENYSVDYLIVNWEMLKPREVPYMREHLAEFQPHADLIQDDAQASVFRLVERDRLARIVRTYSSYHLRRRRVVVRLAEPCAGAVSVNLNGQVAGRLEPRAGWELEWTWDGDIGLRPDGNRLEFIFPHALRIREIVLR